MRTTAARLIEHGQPLRVEEVDLPEPDEGDVVVDMAFGGVNPVDRYGALGRVAPDGPRPRTLGGEGAGRVDGRPVLVRGHGLGAARDGLWAGAAVVPAGAAIDVPEGVALDAAAAMGVAGVTAWRAVTEKAAVQPDDRVLVLGARGGVGSIAVTVAKAIGATVWGQTGIEANGSWIQDRGADRVLVTDAGSLAGAAAELEPTVVIDPLGGGFFGAAIQAMAARGRLVILGTSADPQGEVPLQQLYRKGLTVLGYAGLIEPEDALRHHTTGALEALRDGRLSVVIDRVLPLAEVDDAFRLLTDRQVRGKLVLDLNL
jgi:NADPH2:quinone reductase